jgi:predicted HTH transcriptional regulator
LPRPSWLFPVASTNEKAPDTPKNQPLRTITPDPSQLELEEAHILILLLDHGKVSRREVMGFMGLGETKVKDLFNALMHKKLIIRHGQGRSTCYVLAQNAHPLRIPRV